MTDITIPPAALEAAYNARRNGDTLEDICLAMLRNWPGMFEQKYHDDKSVALILPLPTENTND